MRSRFNEAAGVDPADAPSTTPVSSEAGRPHRFNEAAGVDPADAWRRRHQPNRRSRRFNEAAGVDPADAQSPCAEGGSLRYASRFNEAAGVDPADAPHGFIGSRPGRAELASMRPRG